jgi:predicted enzyme related to lactoylglutathione lyase
MSRKPRFNHVALSLPSASLTPEGTQDLKDFYGDVFGWTELEQMSEPGKRLVLMAHSFEQFVFLVANDKTPTTGARMDHFGLSVATEVEFEETLAKAQAWVAKDGEATQVIGPIDEFYGPLRLRQFYVSHSLPFMVELQWFDWDSVKDLAAPSQEKVTA